MAKEIGKNISRLKGYEPVQGYVERIMKEGLHYNIAKTQYTDDSKITDHYAIIPTGQLTELRSLNELQRSVYDLIVRRFFKYFFTGSRISDGKTCGGRRRGKTFAGAKALKAPDFRDCRKKTGRRKRRQQQRG